MESEDGGDQPRPGLRERKKARTRALIQAEALRLFGERGYDETSIEDIAEAAEVSPSTVLRYFPTKADLIIYDDLDEKMIEIYHSLPPEMSTIDAVRTTFRGVFAELAGPEMEREKIRERLVLEVPEVRSAMLDEFVRTLREIADMVAGRSGRSPDDPEILAFSGAVIGVGLAAWMDADVGDPARYLDLIDMGLARLGTGFRV